jgi:hypothetical protein
MFGSCISVHSSILPTFVIRNRHSFPQFFRPIVVAAVAVRMVGHTHRIFCVAASVNSNRLLPYCRPSGTSALACQFIRLSFCIRHPSFFVQRSRFISPFPDTSFHNRTHERPQNRLKRARRRVICLGTILAFGSIVPDSDNQQTTIP